MAAKVFRFKSFSITREKAGMKLSTDAVLLGAWTADLLKDKKFSAILDIGTGTGILALIMAQNFTNAKVDAVDIDDGAIHDASLNFSASPYKDRLTLIKEDISTFGLENSYGNCRNDNRVYELIICNPPYFDFSAELADDSRKNARCNVSLSADALFSSIARLMADDGRACIIIPVEQEKSYLTVAQKCGLIAADRVMVRSKKDKEPYVILLGFVKSGKLPVLGNQDADETDNENHSVSVGEMNSIHECYLHEYDGSRSVFFSRITANLYLFST